VFLTLVCCVIVDLIYLSAVASQSINDVFSATYTNYRIVFEATQSAGEDLFLRVRVSGSDNTSSNYIYGRYYAGLFDSIAAGNEGKVTATSWQFGATPYPSARGSNIMDICNPFATERTSMSIFSSGRFFQLIGGITTVTTSYTGFTIFPNAGTMTGSVSVYGYNK